MSSKSKYILAITIVSFMSLACVLGLIAIVSSLRISAGGNFKITYTAKHVNAQVSASYAITTSETSMPGGTIIKSGKDSYITFNANDTDETVTKSFNGIDVVIKRNEYLYLKYTFVHTGNLNNSTKFLNIAPRLSFTTLENITIEYGIYKSGNLYWCAELNELTAVRDENPRVEVYVRFSPTISTRNALIDGDFAWDLTGSNEYVYENSYMETGDLKSKIGSASISSIVFESETPQENTQPLMSSKEDYSYEPTQTARADAGVDIYASGSYGIKAYVEGSTLYIRSPYKIKLVSCNNLIQNLTSAYASLTDISLDNFDTSNVTDMSSMFSDCSGLTTLDVSSFNTIKVTDMSSMFYNCSKLTSLDMSGWDTTKVTNMSWMFSYCSGLTSLYIGGWDTSKVTDMSFMFYNCSGLTSLDLSPLDTSKVTDMSRMFANCSKLTILDVSSFDTTNVTDMSFMFSTCSKLTSLDVSGFNTTNVTNMYSMFTGCSGLTSLDVSKFDTSNVTNMTTMFNNCSGLTTIYVSDGWSTSAVTSSRYMFGSCSKLVGGNGTAYNSSYTDKTYARIDTAETPGYLTDIADKQ